MERKKCFYCNAPVVSGSYQMDHFPIPDCNGGTVIVPACLPCHDMKDRLRFDQWPTELVAAIIDDFPSLSRETKIFIAKAFAMASDLVALKTAVRTTPAPGLVCGDVAVSTDPRWAGWVFVRHIDGKNWTTGAKLTDETWGMIAAEIEARKDVG